MMKLPTILSIFLSIICNGQEQSTLDPDDLINIFGMPNSTTSRPLEEISVGTTVDGMRFTDDQGRVCYCVPYYLCDANTNTTVDDPNYTGTNIIDIRFREDTCTKSTEVCCNAPISEDKVPSTIPPDATKLRGCGFRNPNGVDFSVQGGRGNEAQFGEFPWTVAIMQKNNNSYVCGGTLIHPNVVVTGTHCVHKYNSGELKIRAGEWDTQNTIERLQHQERDVSDISSYPDFNEKTLFNDVSLLRLSEPVQLAEHINVACLPNQDDNFDSSKKCIANGWGKDNFGLTGRFAVILKKVDLDMVPHDQCQSMLRNTRLGNRFKLHKTFVCAGGVQGKDTCQGDGGSPLVCPISENRYTLTGMVAWGIGCGMKDVPAVYVRVAHFRSWIDNTVTNWGYDSKGYQGDGGSPLVCPISENRYTLTGMVAWGIGCGMKDVPAVYVRVAHFRSWIDNTVTNWGYDSKGYQV